MLHQNEVEIASFTLRAPAEPSGPGFHSHFRLRQVPRRAIPPIGRRWQTTGLRLLEPGAEGVGILEYHRIGLSLLLQCEFQKRTDRRQLRQVWPPKGVA